MSRILIADDHAVVRAGYRQFLQTEPNITHVESQYARNVIRAGASGYLSHARRADVSLPFV